MLDLEVKATWLENGETRTETLTTDNRDLVAWDLERGRRGWPEEGPFLFQTFLAWSVLKRTGKTELPIGTFLENCTNTEGLKAVDTVPFHQDPGPAS